MALAARMKGKQKKNLSKVKCFNCGEMGHFSSKCLIKNKGDDEKSKRKQVTFVGTSVEIYDLTRRLEEEDFDMISHLSRGIVNEDVWYVENGVRKHMTGSQEVFETLAEWDSTLHMIFGNKIQLQI